MSIGQSMLVCMNWQLARREFGILEDRQVRVQIVKGLSKGWLNDNSGKMTVREHE